MSERLNIKKAVTNLKENKVIKIPGMVPRIKITSKAFKENGKMKDKPDIEPEPDMKADLRDQDYDVADA